MLLNVLAFFVVVESILARPSLIVLGPKVFRLDVYETVSVAVYGLSPGSSPAQVDVLLQHYPNKIKTFSEVRVTLGQEVPKTLSLKVKAVDVPVFVEEGYDSVFLVARYNDGNYQTKVEQRVKLSYNNGLVLIQTDKPIYTPYQTVNIRVIPLGTDLKPFRHNVTLVVQNPMGIIVQQREKIPEENDVTITEIFDLFRRAMTGNWTVSALYGYKNSQNTSAAFKVMEYVLPTFGVKISGPMYILPDENKQVDIDITARYTFNQPVQGTVRIKISVPGIRNDSITILNFATRLSRGSFHLRSLKTKSIKTKLGKAWFPENKRLLVEATVTEKATGKREKMINRNTYFTRTPFRINFQRTPYYFIPGMPFGSEVFVSYPNGNPAANIPLRVTAYGTTQNGQIVEVTKENNTEGKGLIQTDAQGLSWFTVDSPGDARTLAVRVTTSYSKDGFPQKQNTAKDFIAMPYYSKSNSYMSVDVPRTKVGETAKCKIYSNNYGRVVSWISYFVVVRGRIIVHKTISRDIGTVTSFNLRVTPEMLPTARLVAYYIVNDSEIVADSALIDTGSALPTKVVFDAGSKVERLPDTDYNLVITSTPGAHVGVLQVDESVYLLKNKNRLTLESILKKIKTLDIGCGAGSGENNRKVFENAGTTVVSNIGLEDRSHSGHLRCLEDRRRKKRSTNKGKDTLYMCCDAAKKKDKTRDCSTRARELPADLSLECKERFLNCCVQIFQKTDSGKEARMIGSLEELEEQDFSDITLRTFFPESTVHKEEIVGSDGKLRIPLTLPSTITTWKFQAVALSNVTGLGLAAPLDILTFAKFFIKLTLPPSVQRGEQLSVLTTVYNFDDQNLKVNLYLKYSEHFCSGATPSNKYFKFAARLPVKSQSAASANFAIVPIKAGKHTLHVYAYGNSPIARDAVRREILVFAEGVEKKLTSSVTLDPWGVLKGPQSPPGSLHTGRQISKMALNIPLDSVVPETLSARLYLSGELLGPSLQNVIRGDLMSSLQLPTGCVEQTVSKLAPNAYVLKYLSAKRLLTSKTKRQLFDSVQKGVRHVLDNRYHKGTKTGRTWLTAYYQKIFCQLNDLHSGVVDKRIPCASFSWLEAQQSSDGSFKEQSATSEYVAGTIARNIQLTPIEKKLALTSFVLVSMLECRCSNQNRTVKANAIGFLRNNFDRAENLFAVAITTYALALARNAYSQNAARVLERLVTTDNNYSYWVADRDNLGTNIETTAYALLALVDLKKPRQQLGPIVNWLLNQRKAGGVWQSTQDTCVALQALAEYSINYHTNTKKLDMRVEVTGPQLINKTLTEEEALLEHYEKIPEERLDQPLEFDVKATGTGVGQILAEARYNKHDFNDELCQFDIQVAIKEKSHARSKNLKKRSVKRSSRKRGNRKKNKKNRNIKRQSLPAVGEYRTLEICTRYLKNGSQVNNGIIDVVFQSGFTTGNESLKQLKNVTTDIDDYEQSDRGVIFYIRKIRSDNNLCLQFDIKREFDVQAIQPVPVTVYSYYQPDKRCTKLYSVSKGNSNSVPRPECLKGECKCSLGNCCSCKPLQGITYKALARKACNEYDFVFLARLEKAQDGVSWLKYKVKVEKILKLGTKNVKTGRRISFRKSIECACPDLLKGRRYLVMIKDGGGEPYKLDGKVFVTEWPSGRGRIRKLLRKFRKTFDKGNFCS